MSGLRARGMRATLGCIGLRRRRHRRRPDGGASATALLVSMARFEARALALTIAAWVLVLGGAPWTMSTAQAAEPRVAIVVGPSGSATDGYRADGLRAAERARRYTSDVVTVVSPEATWPAVREALQGASIVVYLGHGNGWPSPYSSSPKPRTQNGFGLNPVAGVDDVAHQYFGEAYLAAEVRLAPHAVVLLHHLCYASGHPEPGMAEGSLDVLRQRVDGYASGFIAAGAEAVIADSSTVGPAWYIDAILSGKGSIEEIWRTAPSFHDHVVAFPSRRDPGFVTLLDPTHRRSDYYRSIVGRLPLRADEVAAGAARVARPEEPREPAPSPSPAPVRMGQPALEGRSIAGGDASVVLPFAAGTPHPEALLVGLRWDPLLLDVARATDAASDANAESDDSPVVAAPSPPSASPTGTSATATPPGPVPSAAPASKAPPSEMPTVAGPAGPAPVPLVQPEELGALLVVAGTRETRRGLVAAARVPDQPGLYRLAVSVHAPDGVALDTATQAAIPALIVRVTGQESVAVAAPDRLELDAGAAAELALAVSNTGSGSWVDPMPVTGRDGDRRSFETRTGALVGRWLRLDQLEVDGGVTAIAPVDVQVAPGADKTVRLPLTAPLEPGRYLLVLDVVAPRLGSLVSLGSAPTLVRVLVRGPEPTPVEQRR